MDTVLVTAPRHTPLAIANANPVDAGFNVAVKHLANKCLPFGWDQVKTFAEAPTTLEAVNAYVKEHDKLCIAEEDSDGTIFDCADTNHHLRAWHDSVHLRYQLAFTVAGEAAAAYVQVAHLFRIYGINAKSLRWAELLLADILGLVLHYQRTRKWPKNKRAGTLNEAKRWGTIAREIATAVCADGHGANGGVSPYHEKLALNLSEKTWGGYHA